MVYFAAHAQFIIERHQVYKEVNFKQSFTLSLWLVKITCCWKIHLSYSSKFYEQPWLQERTWKDQLQRKNVSYRISFSKFVPSEFNLQLPSQLISRHLRLRGLIEKACDTRAHHSIIFKLHILVKSFQNFLVLSTLRACSDKNFAHHNIRRKTLQRS